MPITLQFDGYEFKPIITCEVCGKQIQEATKAVAYLPDEGEGILYAHGDCYTESAIDDLEGFLKMLVASCSLLLVFPRDALTTTPPDPSALAPEPVKPYPEIGIAGGSVFPDVLGRDIEPRE
jgi:hypothetical protein